MAGHSQFKNIMHRKGAQDKKRALQFAKLAREVTVAAKSGLPDPNMNPRLRAAIIAARAVNMPKDNIERAIAKAAGGDGENYEEVRYEGYGPGGVAIIVEALTDNRNRTAADVRSAFSKNGGAMGETNSVAFNFDRLGLVQFPAKVASGDDMLEAAIDAGADDVDSNDQAHEITCNPAALNEVREALEKRFGAPDAAKLIWRPKVTAPVDEENGQVLLKLLDILDDHDDVQNVFANFEMDDATLAKLSQ